MRSPTSWAGCRQRSSSWPAVRAQLGVEPVELGHLEALERDVANRGLDVALDAVLVAPDRRRRKVGLRELEPLPHEVADRCVTCCAPAPGDLLDESGKGILGFALAASVRARSIDLATRDGIVSGEGSKLPAVATLAQVPSHWFSVAKFTTVDLAHAPRGVAGSSKRELTCAAQNASELDERGGPPGSRSRHLGIKSPLLFRMS